MPGIFGFYLRPWQSPVSGLASLLSEHELDMFSRKRWTAKSLCSPRVVYNSMVRFFDFIFMFIFMETLK